MSIKKICFIMLLACLCLPASFSQKKADIMFMHDTHSQLDNQAKADTLIRKERAKNPDLFVFDAGDFSMGTLYQMLFKTDAAELTMLGWMGVDATTLGNHEFDYGSQGLHNMLEAAKANFAGMNLKQYDASSTVPSIVLCNENWEKSKPGTAVIKQAFDDYGVAPYVLIEKGGVKIAVIGTFGKDALFCAPTCEMAFDDAVASAQKTIAELKAKEHPDMIVCLSHGGTSTNKSKSEDEILAKKIPEIDLIVSGHSHTALPNPIVHGNTFIVSCGAYAENIGHLTLTQNTDGRWTVATYGLIPVTNDIPSSDAVQMLLTPFQKKIDDTILMPRYGLQSAEVIAQNKETLTTDETGYVISDSIRDSVQKLEVSTENDATTGYGKPVDFACAPSGCIRGFYKAGPLTTAQVFESYSLGTGPDGLTGYPIVTVFITGKDLKSIAELDATLSPMMDTVLLYFSHFAFTYNPNRFLLNKITGGMIVGNDGSLTPIDDEKLYRIAVDLYTMQMMNGVVGVTKGMVSIVPRDAQGNPVTDFKKAIVYTKSGELKAWYAVAHGIKEKGVIDGYKGRRAQMKIIDASRDPVKYFAHPSHFAILLRVIIAALVIIIAAVTVVLIRRNRRRHHAK